MKTSVRLSEKGYTLIEMLVAMAILGIVTTGISVTFVRSYSEYALRESTARMQQQGRLAMTNLEQDMRMVGYGFYDLGNLKINFYNDGVATKNSYPILEANENSFPTVISPKASTDSIIIRYYNSATDSQQDISLSQGVPSASSSNTPVSSTDGLQDGELIVIYEPYDPNVLSKPGSILEVTGFSSGGGLSCLHSRNTASSKLYNPPNPGTNLFPSGGYPVGAKVMKLSLSDLRTIRYYIDGNLNLRRQTQESLTGPVSDRIVASGIEDLQIKYQFKDGTWRDAPVSGSASYDIDNVRALRVSILARTEKPDPRYSDTQDFQLSGLQGDGLAYSGSGYRRMTMSTTIYLRNFAMRG